MQNRIVEIATDKVHLSTERGFMRVSQSGQEIGRVPFPDITGLVVRGFGTSISLNLVSRLASENIPLILCGMDQSPSSVLWPIEGHHAQGLIMEGQIALKRPRQKQLWKQLIAQKITAQAATLECFNIQADEFFCMARRVKSGDPDNLEAQAARRYWPKLTEGLESNFKRSKNGNGLNNLLNYGYTVLRAGMARSVLAAGLHPTFSINHISKGEALRLVSDLMEPFRPYLDLLAIETFQINEQCDDLSPHVKRHLVSVLQMDLNTKHGVSPLQIAMDRLAQSFAKICLGQESQLDLPIGITLKHEKV